MRFYVVVMQVGIHKFFYNSEGNMLSLNRSAKKGESLIQINWLLKWSHRVANLSEKYCNYYILLKRLIAMVAFSGCNDECIPYLRLKRC
jgi:hypothetical protein